MDIFKNKKFCSSDKVSKKRQAQTKRRYLHIFRKGSVSRISKFIKVNKIKTDNPTDKWTEDIKSLNKRGQSNVQ